MQHIYLDIETLPTDREDVIGAITQRSMENIKPPSGYIKSDFARDLELNANDAKFTTVGDMQRMWVERFGEDRAVEQSQEAIHKTSLDATFGQVAMIGYAAGDSAVSVIDAQHKTEAELLAEFFARLRDISSNQHIQLVAHNASFDLPYLYRRAVVNKVNPSLRVNWLGRHGSDYFCTMEGWAGFKGKISADKLAQALGIQGKTEGMHGSQVWPELRAGNWQKVADYCADDVELCRQFHKALTFTE